jgi:hypothetical protein
VERRPVTYEEAGKKIRVAWVCAALVAVFTGGIAIWGMIGGPKVAPGNPAAILPDAILAVVLTVGIALKSRIAAVLMVVYFIFSQALMWIKLPKPGPVVIAVRVYLAYVFIEGARATIIAHRLSKQTSKEEPSAHP